ncbi:MAG: transporter related [Nocardia sp.]|uniref:ABC transporter transmembrane domain-containing protein n=1 Tax=Nocardia sp. TaxID=1821 RepID=UPI002624022F|nr:ABC transporter ATP-binding protein [Nocardia sp.]MCU1644401.1 transporter related [Nocardia sp.]
MTTADLRPAVESVHGTVRTTEPEYSAASILRSALGGQRRHLTVAAVFLSVHQVAEALIPVIVGFVIQRAVTTADGWSLLRWMLLLTIDYLFLTAAMRFGFRANTRAVQGAGHRLRLLLAARILDGRGGRDQLPGSLLSMSAVDTNAVGLLNYAIALAVSGFAGVGVAVYFLLRISALLAGLVLGGAVVLLVLTDLSGRPLARRTSAERAQLAATAGMAADLLTGLRVLKGFGGERAAVRRYRQASRAALRTTLRSATTEAVVRAIAIVLAGFLLAAVTWAAGWSATRSEIGVGAFVTAIGLAQFLLDPLNRITGLGTQRAQSRASAARIAAVLNVPFAVLGSATVSFDTVPSLHFDAVTAGSIADLDLEIAPGEFVGIVTPDPAAAGALADVVSRRADPVSGAVRLDGQPMASLAPDSVRAVVLVPPHEVHLFSGTVLDNIGRINGTADLERIVQAAALRDLGGDNDGLHAPLHGSGVSLSGGQRQRVALARALAADPPVLVLTEPTTAVDSVTELTIADELARIRATKTTVCLTTSPGLLSRCDRVVFIDAGSVIEGRHAELVASSAAYREAVL